MRRQITEVDQLAEDLPDLTPQQMEFVRHILEGKTASDAYRIAYNSQATNPAIWTEASKLRNNPKVALWLSAARVAGFGRIVRTKEERIARMEALVEIGLRSGNVGAAVLAEKNAGLLEGKYIEKLEVNDVTDIRQEMAEIEKLSPEAAKAYAELKGIPYH